MNHSRLLAASEEHITPLAVVDDDVRERNLKRMQDRANAHGLRLRPHAKTHKSSVLAVRQLAHGAVGLTAATMREADVFAEAGVADLLIAHPPAGKPKLQRLQELATRVRRLAVALDTVELAESLPEAVEILWEVDTGLHRLGTTPGQPTLDAVKRLVEVVGPARFRGLMTHGGHSYRATDDTQLTAAAQDESGGLVASAALIRAAGIEVRELSIGSTPTAAHVEMAGGVTEMRPGTYVYGDANQVTLGSQALEDCALAVVATVVSRPERTRAVVDSGSKSLPADLRVAGLNGYGIVLGHPGVTLDRISEEHGVLVSESAIDLSVGDRVAIIPAHACTTVNLHPALLVIRGSQSRWEPVDARGWR
ncbi:MAG TPA: alanine racemase [Candidatus Dormibacteraeota bacterium]|nr:alanine racemase [Candidatus Dormibacteraeota bacterium]